MQLLIRCKIEAGFTRIRFLHFAGATTTSQTLAAAYLLLMDDYQKQTEREREISGGGVIHNGRVNREKNGEQGSFASEKEIVGVVAGKPKPPHQFDLSVLIIIGFPASLTTT